MAGSTGLTKASSELLSQTAQNRLVERVAAAGGNIAAVAAEVNTKLEELDKQRTSADPPQNIQADRAFLVAQLAFLSALEAKEANPQPQSEKAGFLGRLRMMFRRNAPAS